MSIIILQHRKCVVTVTVSSQIFLQSFFAHQNGNATCTLKVDLFVMLTAFRTEHVRSSLEKYLKEEGLVCYDSKVDIKILVVVKSYFAYK